MAASNGLAYRPRITDAELRACLGAPGAEVIEALERLMVLENQPAWRPHLRSKAALRQAPRRHFATPLWRWRRWAAAPIGS